MTRMVTIYVDGISISVPEGMMVVDAARKIGINIPVFCYHPKLEAVGMCRMCLVEIGRPVIDRATNSLILNPDGSTAISFGPKLETACTTPVTEGMLVVTNSEKVVDARRAVLEFLLTSHPLDCPVCDKGGECPLQNLTMQHGPTESRYCYDEKKHSEKRLQLGELVILDRERCIQCSRCVRFQTDVADDAVIGLSQRGRSLEIVTYSNPGFDSIFSGNTTDICPVGALTTVDFRFAARPWEMKSAPSLCGQCAVGCNITFNVRRSASRAGNDAANGSRTVIKRVLPRQNEQVNEQWICDKGRYGYKYTGSPDCLNKPLVREGADLVEVEWEQAFNLAAEKIGAAGNRLVTLAGGRLSNEDLFNLAEVTQAQDGQNLLYTHMAGGELVAQVGLGHGTNLGELGKGTAILVIACDLHEEAPLWWLRIRQAAKRGATLIVANPRPTRLDKFAAHTVRYAYGEELQTANTFSPALMTKMDEHIRLAAEAFASAENAIILYGSEGIGLAESAGLARACAGVLVKSNHFGRRNNGLLGVWPHPNTQGAWELGFRPIVSLPDALKTAKALWIAGADPAGDDPVLARALKSSSFLVVQDLFLTETARLADVVLPARAYTEREGTYTSGERRIQRFYAAVEPLPGTQPDYQIAAQIGERLGISMEKIPARIFKRMAGQTPGWNGLDYARLSQHEDQWPLVSRKDLYYAGSCYENLLGLGVQPTTAAQRGEALHMVDVPPAPVLEILEGALPVFPVTRLYDRGACILLSEILKGKLAKAVLWIHPQTAEKSGVKTGKSTRIHLNGVRLETEFALDERVPQGVVLAPRSVGLPVAGPGTILFGKR